MPDFRFARSRAMINGAIGDQAAADSASDRDIKNRVMSHTRTAPRFAESGDVGIIIHHNGRANERAQPARKVEFRPAFDLVGAGDFAGPPIHRAAETDANSRNLRSPQQFGQCGLNLFADACPAAFGFDGKFTSFENRARLVTKNELEFGASDFEREIGVLHDAIEPGPLAQIKMANGKEFSIPSLSFDAYAQPA